MNRRQTVREQTAAAVSFRDTMGQLEEAAALATDGVQRTAVLLVEAQRVAYETTSAVTAANRKEDERVRNLRRLGPDEVHFPLHFMPPEIRALVFGYIGYRHFFKNANHLVMPPTLVATLACHEMIPRSWQAAHEVETWWSRAAANWPAYASWFPWFAAAVGSDLIGRSGMEHPSLRRSGTAAGTFPALREKVYHGPRAFRTKHVWIVVTGNTGAVEFTCDNAKSVLALIKNHVHMPDVARHKSRVRVNTLTDTVGAVVGFYVPYVDIGPDEYVSFRTTHGLGEGATSLKLWLDKYK